MQFYFIRFDGRPNNENEKLSGLQLLIATFRNLKDPAQVLIIPITFWSGLEQGFFGADFTAVRMTIRSPWNHLNCYLSFSQFQGYVSCAYGIGNLGYVLITFGVCDAIMSFAFGIVINKVGRIPIFYLGAAINVAVILVLFTWQPNPHEGYVFFILAGLWGVADAVWQTQINGETQPLLCHAYYTAVPSDVKNSFLASIALNGP